MALALDSSTPAQVDKTTAGSTATTASFTAPANALLVAWFESDEGGQINSTIADTGGLTWTRLARICANTVGEANTPAPTGTAQDGYVSVWSATTASATSRTVTVTVTGAGGTTREAMFSVMVHTDTGGAPGTGAVVAKGGSASAPSHAVTTTATNSWVWAGISDWSAAGAGTAGSNQTLQHDHPGTNVSAHLVKQNATTPGSGSSVTMNVTAPASQTWNEVVVEVLANGAAGGPAEAGPPVQPQPLTPFPILQRVVQQASLWRPLNFGDIEVTANVTNAPAETAAGTGTAYDPTPTVATVAPIATGTGTAPAPSPKVAPTAGAATATGTANTTTSLVATGPATATATGAAQTPGPKVAPVVGQAGATGTAYDATITAGSATNAQAQTANGTGTAYDPTRLVSPTAPTATGTGVAQTPTVQVAPIAPVATGTGVAQTPTPKVAPTPGTATGTGTAYNATVTTTGAGNAQALTATGTGTANAPSLSVRPVSPLATGTGTAYPAQVLVVHPAAAGTATGTGTAYQPTTRVATSPGLATATGVAYNPGIGAAPAITRGAITEAQRVGISVTGRSKPSASVTEAQRAGARATGAQQTGAGVAGTGRLGTTLTDETV